MSANKSRHCEFLGFTARLLPLPDRPDPTLQRKYSILQLRKNNTKTMFIFLLALGSRYDTFARLPARLIDKGKKMFTFILPFGAQNLIVKIIWSGIRVRAQIKMKL